MKKIYLFLLVLVAVFVACKKDMDVEFSTFEVENEKISPSYTSTELSCKVRCAATINELYLQYDTVADFATYQEVALTENEKTEVYSVKIGDLLDNTTYYVRYVAVNSYSQVTSEEVSEFKTLKAVKPTIEIKEVTNVLDKTVTIKVVLKSDGGAPISKMGVCWSTKSAPTIQDEVVEIKNSSMSIPLSGLTSNTTYFVRAFAENKSGLGYSVDESFLTLDLPKVKTDNVSDIEITSVVLNGELLFNGNDLTTVCGFCWGRADKSEFEDSIQVSKETKFSYQISNLQDETQYRVCAYAKNKIGVMYGEILTFKTQSPLLPSVVTSDVKSISYTTATVEANVTSDGGADVMERGVCYSTSKDPTISNEVVQYGNGIGKFSVSLKDLIAGKTYYVRAYAKNKKGVAYGSSLSFTTLEYGLPIVETLAATNISFASATVGGTVVSDGGVEVVERGVCYSTAENPTIANSKIVVDKGLGSFNVTLSSLQDGTKYYVRAYAINKKGVSYGETVEFETLSRFVDLGLSVKWATCNVGATTPEEYGDYFAWGEVESKEYYDWSTYKYCEGTDNTLTKYCSKSRYGKDGFTDNKIVLVPEDDAATSNWGGAWRMPTYDELNELKTECTWTWTIQNGVNGYKVVGPNGNSIFLPAAGYMRGGALFIAGSNGGYWSSSLLADSPYYAYYMGFKSGNVGWSYYDRGYGRSVRPVYGDVSLPKEKYTISVYSNDNSRGTVSGGGTYDEGCQVTITATANSGYRFKEWNDGNTDNPRVITVTKDAIYTAHFEAEKNLNAGHEYVDLGLSVKWATCNVGATTPEEYGDYFAWGEVEPKEYYDWSTYKYGTDYDQLTKYCTQSSYGKDGFTDNKTVLDPEDDVATANWGSAWRMPTKAEQDELRNNCTWTWTTQNGVNGYKVIGPNGNSIFLPAAGYMSAGALYDAGSYGYYWSSSLLTGSPNDAYYVYFYSGSVDWDYYYGRSYGQSVRPVCH